MVHTLKFWNFTLLKSYGCYILWGETGCMPRGFHFWMELPQNGILHSIDDIVRDIILTCHIISMKNVVWCLFWTRLVMFLLLLCATLHNSLLIISSSFSICKNFNEINMWYVGNPITSFLTRFDVFKNISTDPCIYMNLGS